MTQTERNPPGNIGVDSQFQELVPLNLDTAFFLHKRIFDVCLIPPRGLLCYKKSFLRKCFVNGVGRWPDGLYPEIYAVAQDRPRPIRLS